MSGGQDAPHFRPDVEGLRAVAVLLVLGYHAAVPGFGGGFVGVDVFFVLSGFLITGLLLRELDATGRVSIAGFYARRARRLLPAAALVLGTTLMASFVLASPLRIASIATDVGAAAVYVSNIRFALEANDYFAASGAPSPVLHYWSLNVEEQFYLVYPALLVLAFRLRHTVAVLAAITVASFVASLVVTDINQPAAFYLLPTRAWQLGVGALIAAGAPRLRDVDVRVGAAVTIVGLVLCALAGILINARTPVPGVAAVLPVAGGALVIAGGIRSHRTLPARVLGSPPLRYLGSISYGIYLWHWPLLVLAAEAVGHPLSLRASIAIAVAAIPLAGVTHRVLEAPLRRGAVIGTAPRRNLAQAAFAAGGVLIACAVAVPLSAPMTGTAARLIPPPAAAVAPAPYSFCEAPAIDTDGCIIENPNGQVTVALFGDSHATSWLPAIASVARERGWRFLNVTEGGCPSLVVSLWDPANDAKCSSWRARAFARLGRERPAIVVMTNRSRYDIVSPGTHELVHGETPAFAREWAAGLTEAIDTIRPHVGAVVILSDTPQLATSAPDCVVEHADYATECVTPRSRAISSQLIGVEASVAEQTDSTFVDTTDWLCRPDGCPAVIGPYLAYRDDTHLTIPFAESLASRLKPALNPPG